MKRILLIIAILSAAGLLAWLIVWQPEVETTSGGAPHRVLDLAAAPTGGDFRLTDVAGPVDTRDLRGKVVLIYFGYTWCPDICPTNLAFIANGLKLLTPVELAQVAVLFVSVDPERDNPERLAEYTGYFHPSIRGLTGTAQQLAEAARLFGATYRRTEQPDSAMGYTMDHSSNTYVLEPSGALALTLSHATAPESIVAAIRSVLPSPVQP